MNFYATFVIVYLFGEFGYITYVENSTEANEPTKIQKIKSDANMQMWNLAMYRYIIEEPFLYQSNKRAFQFEAHARKKFNALRRPSGSKSVGLWIKAMEALEEYKKTKSRFENDRFCEQPLSDKVCARALKNKFFKKHKLEFDESNYACVRVTYEFKRNEIDKNYYTEYKPCLVKKKHDDGTRFKIYLQSDYKQPVIGKWKFFVIYKFIINPETGQEEMLSDPKYDNVVGMYRYQAYLSLDYF